MAEVLVALDADGSASETAVTLLAACVSLNPDVPASLVRLTSAGFKVPEAVADEAELPRFPAAACPEV